jgi:hypothetical protein
MSYTEYDREEHFLLVVEQLEVIKELILSNSTAKIRMALILVDNIAEILLFNECEAQFDSDNFYSEVLARKHSPNSKQKIRNSYWKKLELLYSSKKLHSNGILINEQTKHLCQLGHGYRNLAYHNDKHNPAVLPIIVIAYFKAVLELFVELQPSLTTWSVANQKRFSRLIKFGLPSDKLDFIMASKIISKNLDLGLFFEIDYCKKQLIDDIKLRIEQIYKLELPEIPLSEILAQYELKEVLKKDEKVYGLLQEKNKLLNELVKKKTSSSKSYRIGLAKYEQEIKNKTKGFRPTVSEKDIEKAKKESALLKNKSNLESLLLCYSEIDSKLIKIESYLDEAELDYDRYIQNQIDYLRGK